MSFADKVKKMVEEAPVANARGANVNFGPMTVTPVIIQFHGRGKPDKIPLAEYMKENNLTDEDEVELGDNESFALHYDIDVSDLNPSLNFHYEREVTIENSYIDPKDPKKSVLVDWDQTVLPSQEKVFGKDWYKKIIPNGKKVPVVWVAAENVDSLKPPKEGKKVLTVPKFIAVYPDRDACIKARDERYPRREESGQEVEDEEEGPEEGEYSPKLLADVLALYKSTRENKKSTLKMLSNDPFDAGDLDWEAVLKAALESEEE